MPKRVVECVAEALNESCKSVNGSRLLVVGLAYRPNVDDDRESPSYKLLEFLNERGGDVAYYDPYVPVIKPTLEHGHWAGTKSVEWDEPTIHGFDLVLISTAHSCIDYGQLGQWARCIVDTRNAMKGIEAKEGKVWKA
jgi:UDP-N-acetyl-D-glucosamine dehydrogenase